MASVELLANQPRMRVPVRVASVVVTPTYTYGDAVCPPVHFVQGLARLHRCRRGREGQREGSCAPLPVCKTYSAL